LLAAMGFRLRLIGFGFDFKADLLLCSKNYTNTVKENVTAMLPGGFI
jgi:hypothetical protein